MIYKFSVGGDRNKPYLNPILIVGKRFGRVRFRSVVLEKDFSLHGDCQAPDGSMLNIRQILRRVFPDGATFDVRRAVFYKYRRGSHQKGGN